MFDKLRVKPEENAVFLTGAPLNPEGQRERMAQIMFEKFNVPALYVATPGILSIYGSGRTNGIVLDSGDGVTQVVPVCNSLPQAIEKIDLAGRDVTEHLARRILVEQGVNFAGASEMERLRDIKEKLCYVALDFDEENPNSVNSRTITDSYELPDGQNFEVCDERFWAPEILFKPVLNDKQEQGIHQILFNSIMKCDSEIRQDLCSNVILSGGNTMLPGIAERLRKELGQLLPSDITSLKVVALPERKYLTWIGGSILASLSGFQDKFMTRKDYEEKGSSFVHSMSL